MKEPTSARARRVISVLLVVAAAHLGGAYLAERERADLDASFALMTPSATPVVLVPRTGGRPPGRPRQRRRGPRRLVRRLSGPVALASLGDVGGLAPPLPSLPDDGPAAEPARPEIVPPAPSLGGLSPGVKYPVSPGYWQVAERWLLFSKTEFYCVDGFNILKFMTEPCNHIYHCAYPVQDVSDGRIHFAGVIRGRREKYDVSGGGSYSPTRIRVSVAGSGHYKILPIAFTAALDARFLSDDCPPDAKRIRQR